MGRINVAVQAFNRGLVSRLGLARTDLARMPFSAETQTNWVPRVLGSMMLRPGLGYIGNSYNNDKAYYIPFIFAAEDTAILEMTDGDMRVRVNEQIVTRPVVTTQVVNGTFPSDFSVGWTDNDQSGATSDWLSPGRVGFKGTQYSFAIRSQQVTVSGADANKQHAIRLVIESGTLYLRLGTTNGATDYLGELMLGPGTHSLTFTPAGDFYLNIRANTSYYTVLNSVQIEAGGALVLPIPWTEADLPMLRHTQSGDVIFCACMGYQQYQIERRSTTSWSVVKYLPDDGPFLTINTGPIRLTPSALTGDVTITASSALFKSGHVGALFRITSIGQQVSQLFNGDGQSSGFVRVTGTGEQRRFSVNDSGGPINATITLQRSIGEPGAWVDMPAAFNYGGAGTFNDGLDNQIIYYRYTIKTGNYVSGQININITYSSGSITGVARITAVSSATSASAQVLVPFGGATASDVWYEGEWSNFRGWPSAVALHEGRLWFAGKGKVWGSISDAYRSFDDTVEGNSGTIQRSIGEGPVDIINWILPMQRMVLGGEMMEWSARSNSFDEPLNPTNFNLKSPSTQGSSGVAAVKIDTRGAMVDNSGCKVFELLLSNEVLDYSSADLTQFVPDIGEPGIVRMAVQRKIDTRIHCVRSDGTVALLIYDPIEDVRCWVNVETDGFVEDAFTLPANQGRKEDYVYYSVRRTVNEQTVRFLERWSMEEECRGKALSKLGDAHSIYAGAPTTTLTAAHLPNTEVVAWGDGKDLGTFTTNGSGQVTLPAAVSTYCIGLGYTARYRSSKLAYASAGGTALVQRKKVGYLGVVLADTHMRGLRYGPDFDTMDDMPLVEDGAVVPADYVWESYDKDAFEFDGEYDTDSRVCLEAAAPRCVTLLACIIGMETNDRV